MDETAPKYTEALRALLGATLSGDAAGVASRYGEAMAWRCVDAEPQRLCFSRRKIGAETQSLVDVLPPFDPTLGLVLEVDSQAISFYSAHDAEHRLVIGRHSRFNERRKLAEDSLFVDFGALKRARNPAVPGLEVLLDRRTIVARGDEREKRNLERLRAFYDVVNDHYDGQLAEYYKEDARLIDPNSGEVIHGRKPIVRSFAEIWEALPAHRSEPMRLLAAEDFVAVIHIVMLDPPRADPQAPTPRQVEELVLFELHDDRIVSEWTFFNSTRLD